MLQGVANPVVVCDYSDMARKRREGPAVSPLTIQVTGEAGAALESWLKNNVGDKKNVVSRLVMWFTSQPESMQNYALGRPMGDLRSAVAEQLRHAAEQIEREGRAVTAPAAGAPGQSAPPQANVVVRLGAKQQTAHGGARDQSAKG